MKVFIIAALTADGLIGRNGKHTSMRWTSDEDKSFFRSITLNAGIMIMGSRTFATINRSMSGRKIIVYTSRPEELPVFENVDSTSEQPVELLKRLKTEGYTQVAICGGASVYHQFIQAGVVDELYLTIEPILFGRGVSLFNDDLDLKLELLDTKHLNANTLQLIYKVLK